MLSSLLSAALNHPILLVLGLFTVRCPVPAPWLRLPRGVVAPPALPPAPAVTG